MGNRDSIMRSFNLTHVDHDSHPLKTANLPIIFILGGPGAGKGEPHPVGYSREGEAIISRYWLPQGIVINKK